MRGTRGALSPAPLRLPPRLVPRAWCLRLREIGGERVAYRLWQFFYLIPIFGVVDADADIGPALHCPNHFGCELEAQEMHGRGLLLGRALQILVGNRPDSG